MPTPLDAVKNSLGYLKKNPGYLLHAALHATKLSVGIPLDALRWFVERPADAPASKKPKIDLFAAPPALGVAAKINLFGTELSATSEVTVESVDLEEESLKIALRVKNLAVQAPPGSPASMMLGSMDLKRPGSLMGFLPMRPAALIDARDDLFVLDLMKVPKIAAGPLAKLLAVLHDVVTVRDVQVKNDQLVIGFGVQLRTVPLAVMRLRAVTRSN